MSDRAKITEAHRRRRAVVYVRQSTLGQVERNTESAARQYALRNRAVELGWPQESVVVVDGDTGRSGASAAGRVGFKELVAEVGLGTSAWCWRWRSRGWRAPRRTGISCWTCAR
jgi:DNA invertase Pin-like site-specific DNA recombinase